MTPTPTKTAGQVLTAWTAWTPLLGLVLLALTWSHKPSGLAALPVGAVLLAVVLASVHHAEVVAERVGEPFGSLVLAVAVTVIEVGLVVTMMAGGGPGTETLARDTVFAAVMVTCNLVVGLAIVAGARGRTSGVRFNAEGAGSALATVLTVTVLCLVLPSFTTSHPGPQFTGPQLAFAGIASLACYAIFVVTQTVKHRDFFLPVDADGDQTSDAEHHARPTARAAGISLALLVCSLVAVVGLAKVLSPSIEHVVDNLGFPHAFVGVVICVVVIAPETLSAVRNASRGRMQISLNLAYGSAMASVGLTIPALAVATRLMHLPLVLGLGGLHLSLLALTVGVSILTLVPGRAVRLQGYLHLAIAAAFIFLAATP